MSSGWQEHNRSQGEGKWSRRLFEKWTEGISYRNSVRSCRWSFPVGEDHSKATLLYHCLDADPPRCPPPTMVGVECDGFQWLSSLRPAWGHENLLTQEDTLRHTDWHQSITGSTPRLAAGGITVGCESCSRAPWGWDQGRLSLQPLAHSALSPFLPAFLTSIQDPPNMPYASKSPPQTLPLGSPASRTKPFLAAPLPGWCPRVTQRSEALCLQSSPCHVWAALVIRQVFLSLIQADGASLSEDSSPARLLSPFPVLSYPKLFRCFS